MTYGFKIVLPSAFEYEDPKYEKCNFLPHFLDITSFGSYILLSSKLNFFIITFIITLKQSQPFSSSDAYE